MTIDQNQRENGTKPSISPQNAGHPSDSGVCSPVRAQPIEVSKLPWQDDDPWQLWRQLMPISERWAYLDHAAVGPLSAPATQAIRQFADQASLDGDTVWPSWAAEIERLREKTAGLIGAEKSEVCMVPNTSTGINLVAEGWPWKAGDNVILPDGEFPSNLFPWMNQASRGVELKIIPRRGEIVDVEDLINAIDGSTRMIAVSWVGYASGYRVDLETLVAKAHERGVLVFLDAIQGLGLYELDVQKVPVDFLAADGHKWLLGPEGAGVAMIRQQHQDQMRCTNVGWSSVKNSFNYAEPQLQLRDTAARFEPGSANMVGIAALSASMEIFRQVRKHHGEASIGERIVQLSNLLTEKLAEIGVASRMSAAPDAWGSSNQSGIVTFDVPSCEPAEVRRRCLVEDVVVSCRGGGVRASIHAYNNENDLQRLVDVVESSLK